MSESFKDYYSILGVPFCANQESIRAAYRSQSMRWHPDRNQGSDTTKVMQDINEAYLILGNPEKRCKYDVEYRHFFGSGSHDYQSADNHTYHDYEYQNDDFSEDVRRARTTAEEMVEELKKHLKEDLKVAGNELKAGLPPFLGCLTVSIILSILVYCCSG